MPLPFGRGFSSPPFRTGNCGKPGSCQVAILVFLFQIALYSFIKEDIRMQAGSRPLDGSYRPGFEQTAGIIPAYSEARFIGSVVIQARHYACSVVVVDDGSRDD